tara:strand:+ start:46 stop:705 length:660 start_codon:yes stop_codon:yes gene_type:complete
MLYFANNFFSEKQHQDFKKKLLLDSNWIEGSNSASGLAKVNKKNLQLNKNQLYENLCKEIIMCFKKNDLINNYAFPEKIFSILFSRTSVGMYYKPHIDLSYIDGHRRDFSFTIFLNDPDEYKGGELILNIPPEKKAIKLKAGQIIIYPTKYLHEVKEVIEGERIVCVGWIESEIANNEDRENMTILKTTLNEIVTNYGTSSTSTQLSIAVNNLYKRFIC